MKLTAFLVIFSSYVLILLCTVNGDKEDGKGALFEDKTYILQNYGKLVVQCIIII